MARKHTGCEVDCCRTVQLGFLIKNTLDKIAGVRGGFVPT